MTQAATEAGQTASTDTATEGAEHLGDAGKRALDRQTAARKAAEDRARTAEAELEELRSASKPAAERELDKARKAGRDEGLKAGHTLLRRAEAKAAAAHAKFRDPSDVIAQLGASLDEVAVDENGEVDTDALNALVTALATAKPYLINTEAGTAPAAAAGIGSTGDKGKPAAKPGLDRMRSAYAASTT
jgi:hypothetical protein